MPPEVASSPRSRFVALDGLRGLAAIGVALFHYDGKLMPGGYLAVDFFFVLSGFVLVRTYEPRLSAGLGRGRFIAMRIIRLYPLYLMGVLLGATYLLQRQLRGEGMAMEKLVTSVSFNLFMLPAPFSGALFPANSPAWSLLFELLVNIAMALFLIRKATPVLAGFALAAGVLLIVLAGGAHVEITSGPPLSAFSGGPDWVSAPIGALRTLFSFVVGMIIARFPVPETRAKVLWAVPLWSVLVLALALPISWAWRPLFDATFILAISPALVLVNSRIEPVALVAPAAALLGELSYAMYAVHMPIAHGFASIAARLGLGTLAVAPIYVAVLIPISWLGVHFYDEPVRSLLTRRLLPKRGRQAA